MPVAAAANALVTLEEWQRFLQPAATPAGATDPSADYQQELINAHSAEAEKFVGGPLRVDSADRTEYFTGGGEWLFDLQLPIFSVTSVKEDGTALTPAADGSTKTAGGDSPDYWIEPEIGLLRNGKWHSGRRAIEVKYKAGRWSAVSDVPYNVKMAILAWMKATHEAGAAAFGPRFLEGGQVIEPVAMPKFTHNILRKYKIDRIA